MIANVNSVCQNYEEGLRMIHDGCRINVSE